MTQVTNEVLDFLISKNATMDFILEFVEASPALHTPETLTKLLASYKTTHHLKIEEFLKLISYPFAQQQQTIQEFLYVYPKPTAWGIFLLLWKFEFARTPEVFEAFIDAKPDEYETQLCQELCPEFRAYLTA